jgi:hypothetical protein
MKRVLYWVRADAEERIERQHFSVGYEIRPKKQLSINCVVCGVRANAKERVEHQLFSVGYELRPKE